MEFPLAHDENGAPLDVPATAIGWLVRRHAGGRGRPAAVYDADGRPLLVALDATAADLRAEGCRAGTYRLDAVDSNRRLLNVAAYTEVLFDGAADAGLDLAASAGHSDAAVAALARAVEAMQRVQAERERAQAERERVQAEMLARLVDRLAPPAPVAQRSLPEALSEYEQAASLIRNLAPEPEYEDEEEPARAKAPTNPVIEMIGQAMAVAMERLMTPPQSLRNAAPPVADEGEQEEEGDDSETPEPTEETSDEAMLKSKFDAVLALLTRDEARRVFALQETLPAPMIHQALQRLMTMTPEEGAATIRGMLAQYPNVATQVA
jgi:hypothetical protein